jgi:hypothetical protein
MTARTKQKQEIQSEEKKKKETKGLLKIRFIKYLK